MSLRAEWLEMLSHRHHLSHHHGPVWWILISANLLAFLLVIVFSNDFSVSRLLLGGERSMLDGCQHVFLDVGTNRGVQIRKLFQPHLFPSAPILDQFRLTFGPPQPSPHPSSSNSKPVSWGRSVCAVGLEPNPARDQELEAMERHYKHNCSYRVIVFRRTAATRHGEGRQIWYQPSADKFSIGGRIIDSTAGPMTGPKPIRVRSLRLSQFILDQVAGRTLPFPEAGSSVLLKMDVEGAESEIIADLVLSGATKHVDKVLVEWHKPGDPVWWALKGLFSAGSNTDLTALAQQQQIDPLRDQFVTMDDETYYDAQFETNTC